MSTGDKTSGGEGGIRTPDTGVSPYNGLAIAHQFALRNVLKGLQSGSEALIRGESFSIGTKCSLFCSPMLVDSQGKSVRHLAKGVRNFPVDDRPID
jgi:hypothetical protein